MTTELTMSRPALAPQISMIPTANEMSILLQMADAIVKSGLAPASINTAQKALIIMLKARELGVPPMQALSTIHVVDGKPTLAADLMVGLLRREGHKVWVTETSTAKCAMRGHRRGEPEHTVEVTFTEDDAKKSGKWGSGTWAKYPAQMLYARCAARLCRMVAPDVLAGMYTAEEMGAEIQYSDDGQEVVVTTVAAPEQVKPNLPPAMDRAAKNYEAKTDQPATTHPAPAPAPAPAANGKEDPARGSRMKMDEYADWLGVVTGLDPRKDKSGVAKVQAHYGMKGAQDWYNALKAAGSQDPYRDMLKLTIKFLASPTGGNCRWGWNSDVGLPAPVEDTAFGPAVSTIVPEPEEDVDPIDRPF
jgi:hypothetical protein